MTGRADRIWGLLLFLPVPLVLWLLTRAPFGVRLSLGLAAAVMASHRLYARPFALARAQRRCLWCGGGIGRDSAATSAGEVAAVAVPPIELREPGAVSTWRACVPAHAALVGNLLTWTAAHAAWLRAGILGPLALLLLCGFPAARGWLGPLRFEDLVALFRITIAVTVLALATVGPRQRPPVPRPRVPFPVHIQALIGTRYVLWLFRGIGVVWLALGVLALARRTR